MSAPQLQPKNTAAFFIQSVIAFGVSSTGLLVAIAYLPLDAWQRSFLAMTVVFMATSAFTLAKVIRDKEEGSTVISRLDEARLEQMLAAHDPFKPAKL